jgi:SEL1 protein
VDQGKAQLYSTFAANGGDKGAQMALAYRYWTGIGTSESCERALAWYGSAAEQGVFTIIHDCLHQNIYPRSHMKL